MAIDQALVDELRCKLNPEELLEQLKKANATEDPNKYLREYVLPSTNGHAEPESAKHAEPRVFTVRECMKSRTNADSTTEIYSAGWVLCRVNEQGQEKFAGTDIRWVGRVTAVHRPFKDEVTAQERADAYEAYESTKLEAEDCTQKTMRYWTAPIKPVTEGVKIQRKLSVDETAKMDAQIRAAKQAGERFNDREVNSYSDLVGLWLSKM